MIRFRSSQLFPLKVRSSDLDGANDMMSALGKNANQGDMMDVIGQLSKRLHKSPTIVRKWGAVGREKQLIVCEVNI